jgi:polysaccharide export outer membrane protein
MRVLVFLSSYRFHRLLVIVLGIFLVGVNVKVRAQSQDTDSSASQSSGSSDRRLGPQDLRVNPADQTIKGTPPPETLPDNGPQQASPAEAVAGNYTIGSEDVLDFEVFNVPELAKSVRVANDGTIDLPLIGKVQAAGLTSDQLRDNVEKMYGETYLQNPHVSVFVKEFHAQPVAVIGAVEQPGLYHLTGPRTLIEMLSMAGGLAKRSSAPAGNVLYVTRKGGFGNLAMAEGMQLVAPDRLEINIQRLLYSRNDALNIPVHPLDTISVAKADIVYVVGDVQKPGGFVLENQERITVLQAVAMAEGLLSTAAKGSARIIRQSPDGAREEVPIDLGKVLAGKAQDVELASNDILFVPGSKAKSALKRGAEITLGTMSGILIYRSRRY